MLTSGVRRKARPSIFSIRFAVFVCVSMFVYAFFNSPKIPPKQVIQSVQSRAEQPQQQQQQQQQQPEIVNERLTGGSNDDAAEGDVQLADAAKPAAATLSSTSDADAGSRSPTTRARQRGGAAAAASQSDSRNLVSTYSLTHTTQLTHTLIFSLLPLPSEIFGQIHPQVNFSGTGGKKKVAPGSAGSNMFLMLLLLLLLFFYLSLSLPPSFSFPLGSLR